jgi:ABC-type multidrug transport system fused ATPase/permease subunit
MQRGYFISLIVIISVFVSLNTFRVFSIEEISILLTVIGLIYGLIAAFSISNSWEKFSKIRDAISEETASLKIVFIYSKYLTDKASFLKIKNKVLEYATEVPKIEWREYAKKNSIHKKFEELIDLVASIRIKDERDEGLFSNISEELREAISSRNIQIIISKTRISWLQWALMIFLSAILIIGLALLEIPNSSLYLFIIVSMTLSILFILYVIQELDSLKIADREVYVEPYEEVVSLIKEN